MTAAAVVITLGRQTVAAVLLALLLACAAVAWWDVPRSWREAGLRAGTVGFGLVAGLIAGLGLAGFWS